MKIHLDMSGTKLAENNLKEYFYKWVRSNDGGAGYVLTFG